MRIAIVTPGYSANDTDWCIPALQDLVCWLGERHQVHVFSTTYPHRTDDYRVKGIPVSSFGNGRSGRLARLRRMCKTAAAIETAHRVEPFDVLHGFWTYHGGMVTAWVARRLGLPNIVTVMAGELTYESQIGYGSRDRPIAGRMARFGARRADTLIVNSRYHANRLHAEYPGLDPQIVPLGYDPARFSPDGPAADLQGVIPVLCVGSLTPVKGHKALLQAFATAFAQIEGLHLHVIGQGERKSALRREAARLGIEKSTTFHGHIEHDRLPAYYRGASFCVSSSYFESHCMVILEAAGCGRITIGSAVGSSPDFCAADYLNRPGDSLALADKLLKVATNDELRKKLAQKAGDTALDEYTLEQSVQAHVDVYRSCRARS